MRTKKPPVDLSPVIVDAYPPLAAWLADHNGRRRWRRTIDGNELQAWTVSSGSRAGLVIVLLQPEGRGWELFTGPDTIEIVKVLEDAAARLGFAVKTVADSTSPEK